MKRAARPRGTAHRGRPRSGPARRCGPAHPARHRGPSAPPRAAGCRRARHAHDPPALALADGDPLTAATPLPVCDGSSFITRRRSLPPIGTRTPLRPSHPDGQRARAAQEQPAPSRDHVTCSAWVAPQHARPAAIRPAAARARRLPFAQVGDRIAGRRQLRGGDEVRFREGRAWQARCAAGKRALRGFRARRPSALPARAACGAQSNRAHSASERTGVEAWSSSVSSLSRSGRGLPVPTDPGSSGRSRRGYKNHKLASAGKPTRHWQDPGQRARGITTGVP